MLSALVLAAGCLGPPANPVAGEFEPLDGHIQALMDPQRGLALNEVLREPACSRFENVRDQPNFGAIAGGVWMRFNAAVPTAPAEWRLVVRFAGLEKVCVHWPLVTKTVASECLVRADPQQRTRWHNGRLVFAVPALLNRAAPVHVYAESKLWLKAPMELATAEYLLRQETRRELGWGMYYGLLITLVVVSLGFYVGGRDRAFLLFALKIGALTLALAIWQGRFVAWDPAGWSLTRLAPPLIALFLVFGSRFYQDFLLTQRYARVSHHVLSACVGAALLAGALELLFPVRAVQALGVISLVWLGAVLWAAIKRSRSFAPARWVLAAVAVLLVAIFMNAAAIIGVLLLDAGLTLQLAYVGNLVAAAFLVFGMIARVRLLGAERDRAQELAAANRNLALYRAHFDEITGLPNRAKFKQDLQGRITATINTPRRLAVITLSPDRFREVNQALGPEGSEAVLIELAGRLRQETGADELLARVGPSTFALLAEPEPGAGVAGLEARTARLRKALTAPLMSGRGATLSFSMGAALYPDHGAIAEQLMRCSDLAHDRAREATGTLLRIFDPLYQQRASRYLELNQDLRHALAHDQLELHYQPLCDLDGNRIVAVEALLRWHHKGVDVPPDQFIPVAESTDLIGPLTDWVFRRACEQARDWIVQGHTVQVCVNVSAPQFRLHDFVDRIDTALRETGIAAEQFSVEITESLLMDDLEATRGTLARLRQRGIEVAVDDFGVGYSSLAYLRTLPVRSVKIDRSFLVGIPHEPEARAVINAIIALGRDLGLNVIAEGIETQAQHDFLVEHGVRIGQGFLMARPMRAKALIEWLRERQRTSAAA